MRALLDLLDHPMVGALGWTLLHFVWQGALIGLAAFVLLRLVRPVDASVRYVIGLGALGAMLVTAGGTLAMMAASSHDSRAGAATGDVHGTLSSAYVTGHIISEAPANPSAARRLLPASSSRLPAEPVLPSAPFWLVGATLAWAVGVSILSMRLLGGWMLTQTLARRAITAVSPAIECAARQVARRLELQRAVAVLESSAVAVPTLVGWVRPVVLLPASALSGLSPVQLEAILAHELAHVRRHDYLANLLQSVVETLLFYHPAVWWVSAEVRAEREHCCDDLAVAVCGDRLLYVSALTELISLERRSLALAATDGSLLSRVRRILGRPAERRRELPPSWGILALLAVLAGAGSLEMSSAASAREPIATAPAELPATIEQRGGVDPAPAAPVAAAAPVVPVAPVIPQVLKALPAPAAPAVPALPEAPALAAPAAPVAPVPEAPSALEAHAVPVAPVAPVEPVLQTPPAPPAPPSPPSPPSPPAPPSPPPAVEINTSRGEGNFSWSNNGDRITVKWTGPFRLSDDERDIAWVEEGARVTVSNGWVFTDRIELRGLDGGRVERNFYKSGFKSEYQSEGRLFLSNVLARMIRSGMFASQRVTRFLAQGGPDAVLAEVDRLQTDSNYVKRVYYSELLKQADLDNAQLGRMLQRITDGMTSDYDRSTLLVQILREGKLTEEQQIAVARAASRIGSDYDQRKVLAALMTTATPLSAGVATAVIEAAESIGSAYDRSTVLAELAGKGAVTPETSAKFMAAVGSMGSAYEQRKVLSALATAQPLSEPVVLDGVKAAGGIGSAYDKRQTLSAYVARSAASPKVAAAALASAATIGSSHDKAEVLLDVVQKGGVTDETATAFFSAATTIGSSYDLGRVLRAVAALPRLSETTLAGLVRAAGSVSSSYDRATLLLEILKNQSLSPSARALFLDVAQTISSQHDQNRVLAELVRSERR